MATTAPIVAAVVECHEGVLSRVLRAVSCRVQAPARPDSTEILLYQEIGNGDELTVSHGFSGIWPSS